MKDERHDDNFLNDETLLGALRATPPERAREGFTGGVLARLGTAPRAPFPAFAWRFAVAAGAMLALAVPLAVQSHRETERRARLRALAAAHDELAGELDALRTEVEETTPVIYLGGDDETDVVLDLDRLARLREQVRPAADRPSP